MVRVAGRATCGGPAGLSRERSVGTGLPIAGAEKVEAPQAPPSDRWADRASRVQELVLGRGGRNAGQYGGRGRSHHSDWIAAMPTMGRFSFKPPADPKNPASP